MKAESANKICPKEVFVKTSTWKRDSHGLFDYESTSVDECELALAQNCLLARSVQGDLKVFYPGEEVVSGYTPLFKVVEVDTGILTLKQNFPIDSSKWTLESCTTKNVYDNPEGQLWTVSGNLPTDYKLKRGDILRIGRIQLKVKDYCIESSCSKEDQISSPNEDCIIDVQVREDAPSSSEDVCRICFSPETSPDNPLLSVCNCTGTMKFIHYFCVKTWLHSNSSEKVSSEVISYYWKAFHCEICTSMYPCKFRLKIG